MKKVSAIIVNWNGKNETADCIQSLLDQSYSNLEIIVSDNGSTDGSIEILQKQFSSSIRLLQNGSNLGFGAAVNRGLEAARGDYLIFLNNDLVLAPDSIVELVQLLQSNDDMGAAVPKILYYEKREIINSFGVLIHFTGIACPNKIDQADDLNLNLIETACGGIFMLPRKVYETTGGFDEDLFLYHEDHDLSWRIRLNGWKIIATPKAVLYHHYKFNKGIKKFYYSEKNRLHILLKNLEWKTLGLILPALLLIEFAQWIHAILHGWLHLKAKSYLELFALLPRILQKREKIQDARKIPDRDIIRLYKGKLAIAGMNDSLIENFLSPILDTYWSWIRGWI
ncbi:MAG: glycosyl transferase [Nitrospinaceae bacterium]|nr:MAG: glycosyl transferase [Nitrospinaceae bacterium]